MPCTPFVSGSWTRSAYGSYIALDMAGGTCTSGRLKTNTIVHDGGQGLLEKKGEAGGGSGLRRWRGSA